AGEGRGEHAVEPRLHPGIVAVRGFVGQPERLDELAVVVVLDERRPAAVVLLVGEAGDQHPTRESEERVRAQDPVAVLGEGVEGADELRVRRVRRHVEDPDLAVVEPPGPEVTAVVAEARGVRLVAATSMSPRLVPIEGTGRVWCKPSDTDSTVMVWLSSRSGG